MDNLWTKHKCMSLFNKRDNDWEKSLFYRIGDVEFSALGPLMFTWYVSGMVKRKNINKSMLQRSEAAAIHCYVCHWGGLYAKNDGIMLTTRFMAASWLSDGLHPETFSHLAHQELVIHTRTPNVRHPFCCGSVHSCCPAPHPPRCSRMRCSSVDRCVLLHHPNCV